MLQAFLEAGPGSSPHGMPFCSELLPLFMAVVTQRFHLGGMLSSGPKRGREGDAGSISGSSQCISRNGVKQADLSLVSKGVCFFSGQEQL